MSYAITDEIIQTIIDELGSKLPEYDSHAVIFEIMKRHPQQYTTDLYGFVSSPDPILSLHASIGQRLLGFESHSPTEKGKSPNARGENTENQKWRKKN